jgi:hypothetical protein
MTLRETDLYPPLAAYLEQAGYTVHAEVQGTDIAARKEDALVLVEMKLRFNLDVLLQAAEKQGAADETYIAVPVQGTRRWPPRWSAIKELLGRLGIGVFFVRLTRDRPPWAEKILPAENPRLKGKLPSKNKVRAGLVREMEGRPANFNTGGSVKKKIVTAYLVNALRVALLLRKNPDPPSAPGFGNSPRKPRSGLLARGLEIRRTSNAKKCAGPGTLSPKALRNMGAPQNCASILYNNYRGWFKRLGKGLYTLTPAGENALLEYKNVIELFRNLSF